MLIYLFALSSENNEKFKKAVNAENVIPAGIMYFPARMADKMADPKKSDEVLLRENFKRNGYLLEDSEILGAMDKLGTGFYIPTGKNLYSLSTLGEVKKGIEKTINYRSALKTFEIKDDGVLSFILKAGQNEQIPSLRADEFLKTIFGESNIFKIKRVKFFDTDLRVI